MKVRKPSQAGFFYPASAQACRRDLTEYYSQAQASLTDKCLEKAMAGIVPHAGWAYSGATAAHVFHALTLTTPQTFLLFGAVHVPGIRRAAVWIGDGWETPLGMMPVHQELAERLAEASGGLIEKNAPGHEREHSLEVELPFLQFRFPDASLVAVMVPPDEHAAQVGQIAAEIAGAEVVALASTDMTHYGSRFDFAPVGLGPQAVEWVKTYNDPRMISLMLQLKADEVIDEAEEHHNACGAGAIAALLAYAKARGKKEGRLVAYTTSQDVFPERAVDSFVGYAGVVF